MASYNYKSRESEDDEDDDQIEKAKQRSAEFRKLCKKKIF